MAGVNKVILLGNLGADPEMRSTQNGTSVTNFRIATSEKWMDKSGVPQEKTEWHRIVAFGKLAEICNQYLSKGRQAYIEGSISTNEWEDKDGNKRFTTEIKAQVVQFIGGAGGGGQEQEQKQEKPAGSGAGGWNPPPPIADDDVPF